SASGRAAWCATTRTARRRSPASARPPRPSAGRRAARSRAACQARRATARCSSGSSPGDGDQDRAGPLCGGRYARSGLLAEDRMSLVTVSEAAAGQIKRLLDQDGKAASHALRMKVVGGGCSGLQYQLMFDDQRKESDHEIESGGVRVLIDE